MVVLEENVQRGLRAALSIKGSAGGGQMKISEEKQPGGVARGCLVMLGWNAYIPNTQGISL